MTYLLQVSCLNRFFEPLLKLLLQFDSHDVVEEFVCAILLLLPVLLLLLLLLLLLFFTRRNEWRNWTEGQDRRGNRRCLARGGLFVVCKIKWSSFVMTMMCVLCDIMIQKTTRSHLSGPGNDLPSLTHLSLSSRVESSSFPASLKESVGDYISTVGRYVISIV